MSWKTGWRSSALGVDAEARGLEVDLERYALVEGSVLQRRATPVAATVRGRSRRRAWVEESRDPRRGSVLVGDGSSQSSSLTRAPSSRDLERPASRLTAPLRRRSAFVESTTFACRLDAAVVVVVRTGCRRTRAPSRRCQRPSTRIPRSPRPTCRSGCPFRRRTSSTEEPKNRAARAHDQEPKARDRYQDRKRRRVDVRVVAEEQNRWAEYPVIGKATRSLAARRGGPRSS